MAIKRSIITLLFNIVFKITPNSLKQLPCCIELSKTGLTFAISGLDELLQKERQVVVC